MTQSARDTGGPATAGPATAGPATAGKATAGPATAGQATAGPATAGKATAGPAGPATAGKATAGKATAGKATAGPARRRQRNARGEGARLGDDIVGGALALIERAGSAEAVTLRAVAREVGIAAPSIYPHFADREAIVLAVVQRVFDELAEAVERATAAAGPDPADRLAAGCAAYVDYGLGHPARYGVLFTGPHGSADAYCVPVELGPGGLPVLEWGAEAFALLVRAIEDCARAGVSASADPVADATAVWVALHGMVTLRTALPGFPWPEPGAFIRHVVGSLARVSAP
jgi:AcrR family transcriptional regulator